MLSLRTAHRTVASWRTFTASECKSVCRCACGGVGNSQESDEGAEDDCCLTGTTCTNQRIALLVIRLHGDCRECEVSAVNADDGGLNQTGTRVGGLNGRMHGDNGDDQKEDEVDGDGGLVHRAAGVSEEDVHDDCHGER